jgi:predicted GNAT family N-acyltransferase
VSNSALFKPKVSVVRRVDELIEVIALRSMIYVEEQLCPFGEEFDGNDLCATHLLLRCGQEPAGTMRMRWFADFVKFERICVRAQYRGSDAVRLILDQAFELAARKGFKRVIAQIERPLVPYWSRAAGLRPRPGRASMVFSDREYVEVERILDDHEARICADAPAAIMLRPEGEWDREGVLDRSRRRGAKTKALAASRR